MNFIAIGRVLPERAGAWFAPMTRHSPTGERYLVSCEASQVSIVADLPNTSDVQDAAIRCEQVGQAIVSALGFTFGCGYSFELIQVVTEADDTYTFGVRPFDLGFADSDAVLKGAAELVWVDVAFRFALRDYTRALTQVLDCAHYCYRAIEAIKSNFGANNDGWGKLHHALKTSKDEIESTVKAFADPIRHGNWLASRTTTNADRMKMYRLTREILRRYMEWRAANPIYGSPE